MNYFYISLAGISLYYGYYYGKNYLNQYIMSKVLNELNKKQNEEGEVFKPLEKSKSALILYKHGGKDHRVCIPYDRSRVISMMRKDVKLITNEGEIDITHKPGIPYLLSAFQMGGNKILVKKDNKIIREYVEHEIPNYLE